MKIYGIDFTSRPSRRKPLTCLECNLNDTTLIAGKLFEWSNFKDLEAMLESPGPWTAGLDFPFGQSRKFIVNIGWPQSWAQYVEYVKTLNREDFRTELDKYRAQRPVGDKEHRRVTDIAARSISPQKLYGVPVGLMFYEGSPRIRKANVTVPGLQVGDPDRIVVEAYPGVLARHLVGKQGYKHDTKRKQTRAHQEARILILENILGNRLLTDYGLEVKAELSLAEDPTGDQLDALLCAIQAAWAWLKRDKNFGMPKIMDPLEGWIADPMVSAVANQNRLTKNRGE